MIFFFAFGGYAQANQTPELPIVAQGGGGAPVGSYGHYVVERGDVRASISVVGASDEELLFLIRLFFQARDRSNK